MRFPSRTLMAPLLILFLLLAPGAVGPAFSGGLRVLGEPSGRTVQLHNGGLYGWAVDIVREIMRRAGSEAAIEPTPWARAYDIALHTPGVVLFPMTRTEEREPLFNWVGPIFRMRWYLFARKGSGVVLHSLDDARRVKAIGTYIDDAREQYLRGLGFTNLERAANNETNYRKLEYGRLDLIAGSDAELAAMADYAGVNPDNFERAWPLKEMDLYVALSRGTEPGNVAAWREAFRAMREDGTFSRILSRWYPGMEPPLDERVPWRRKAQ